MQALYYVCIIGAALEARSAIKTPGRSAILPAIFATVYLATAFGAAAYL